MSRERLIINFSVVLAIEMTRAALRVITGSDLSWGQIDIVVEPARSGRWIGDLVADGDRDATNDEMTRTVRVKGYYTEIGGKSTFFESRCRLNNFRSVWEPQFVDVEIDGVHRHFFYINERRWKKYFSAIKEGEPVPAA